MFELKSLQLLFTFLTFYQFAKPSHIFTYIITSIHDVINILNGCWILRVPNFIAPCRNSKMDYVFPMLRTVIHHCWGISAFNGFLMLVPVFGDNHFYTKGTASVNSSFWQIYGHRNDKNLFLSFVPTDLFLKKFGYRLDCEIVQFI